MVALPALLLSLNVVVDAPVNKFSMKAEPAVLLPKKLVPPLLKLRMMVLPAVLLSRNLVTPPPELKIAEGRQYVGGLGSSS
jgi:hypothetical protein